MAKFLAVVIVILAVVAIGQLARVYDLTRDLRGKREEDISPRDNKLNANLMIVFMLVFFVTTIWQIIEFGITLPESASEHGVALDNLLNFNFIIVLAVFFFCNALLFGFARKYYHREDRKALYFPHNNKLEMLWTVVPAVVLAVIIIYGLKTWQDITDLEGDPDNIVVELYSKQFDWTARYGGADNELGDFNYLLTGMSGNPLGLISKEHLEKQFNAFVRLAKLNEQKLATHNVCDSCDVKVRNIEMALNKIATWTHKKNESVLEALIEGEKHHGAHGGHGNAHGEGTTHQEHDVTEGSGSGNEADHAHHGDHGHGHGAPEREHLGNIHPYLEMWYSDQAHGVEKLKQMVMECKKIIAAHGLGIMGTEEYAMAAADHKRYTRFAARIKKMQGRHVRIPYNIGTDDVIVIGEFLLPVDREVQFLMRSKDVIHSAYMPHFRAQMNTVPGMITPFRFTPTITTREMQEKLDDPNFEYYLLCNKICGANHYNMKMKIRVVPQKEYDDWMKEQETFGLAIQEIAGIDTKTENTLARVETSGNEAPNYAPVNGNENAVANVEVPSGVELPINGNK